MTEQMIARPEKQRSFLKERVYNEIKAEIISARIPPRSFLSERMLSARYKVSKTPIRNALERLACEGLVSISPQQGIVVQEAGIQELVDLFDVRLALETYVAGAIAGKLTVDQIERLRANLGQQEAGAAGNNVDENVRLDTVFHLLLSEFTGNQEMVRIMRQSRDKMCRAITRVNRIHRGRIAASVQEHADIAAALVAGDTARAITCVKKHLEFGRQSLIGR